MKINIKSKFKFDEIVSISTDDSEKKDLNGMTGYVAGMSYDDPEYEGQEVECQGYGVFIFDKKEVWSFDEDELESTGEFVPEGYGHSGLTMTVNRKGQITGFKDTSEK